jgi:ATP-dependent Clp protease ATP-binding subunit ClpC
MLPGNFTDRAKKVFVLANQEAQRMNHNHIDTEHILIGLIKEGSIGADVLKKLGVTRNNAREEYEKIVRSGPDATIAGELSLTPQSEKTIEYAIEEARNLNDGDIDTEHILLGLIREQDKASIAIQVLINLGLSLSEIRKEILAKRFNPVR